MAGSTTNLSLIKPTYSEDADIADINTNMDTLDSKIGPVGGTSLQAQVSKILPVISGTTNNSGYAISAGEYFEANGALYKASASIPTGNAWSSSATAQSDHGAVNALNSKLTTVSGKVENFTDGYSTVSSNLNNITYTGFFSFNDHTQNTPGNGYGSGIAILGGPTSNPWWKLQIAMTTQNKLYTRHNTYGTWTEWVEKT